MAKESLIVPRMHLKRVLVPFGWTAGHSSAVCLHILYYRAGTGRRHFVFPGEDWPSSPPPVPFQSFLYSASHSSSSSSSPRRQSDSHVMEICNPNAARSFILLCCPSTWENLKRAMIEEKPTKLGVEHASVPLIFAHGVL